MNWQSLFDHGREITAEEAHEYIGNLPPHDLQLIDVRQPKEYRDAHIPGAVLIPLNELPQRLGEIDPARNTIVYCRSGHRSAAACQILGQAGIARVLNLRGGMLQWQGNRAAGEETEGLEFFVRGDFPSAAAMACSMEAGLKEFYLAAAAQTVDPESRNFLVAMARLEDGHITRLRERHGLAETDPAATMPTGVIEGGMQTADIIEAFRTSFTDLQSLVQLAMMFEAQALDLYSRLARRQDNPGLRNFFLDMAGEERHHLNRLARELDKLLT
ncbi:sulfurtransferase [Desulfoprunum benzoelyticum]|uniref:Rhodanese-related sulfurtransferase n=1 Tax=Desulfoprunum benzoelyticum TaxID=1506996 RepID=A0A840URG1_9BACT|nr:rhodanese-like domain-containing protein [Desulfoprunum benzoelyticum]MBB5348807.1 rhodanese-related sulfurtransferase [Desulfoprunum benzoelyticum]MBM9529970.1 sulfurtransferase [Desulfoprunum benzoelyticum]